MITAEDGNDWLDCNLGASEIASSPTDSAAYGDLYQWGRLADGHQHRSSGTTNTQSSGAVPGHSNFITPTGTLNDWLSSPINNLWGASGTNNPCPTGFHVPTQAEWATLISAAHITNTATGYSSMLKLTLPGYRDFRLGGSLQHVGSFAYYWSSTPNSYFANDINNVFDGIDPSDFNFRAYGYSVRCIKN